jgi:hypothetical protein
MEYCMRSRIPGLLAAALVAAVACSCGGPADMTTAPTACAAAVSPATQHVSAGGGTFAVAITVSPSCEWAAASDASWVTMVRGAGSGSGSAAYTVAPQTTAASRTARISVGTESIVVTQSSSDCSYALDRSSATVPPAGGTIEFRLGTNDGCGWSASAGEPWISLGTTSGNGPRMLSASIAANTAATPRSGSIQVEGQTIAISQAASDPTPGPGPAPGSCSFEVTPREQTVGAAGGRLEIRLTADGEACGWTAHAADSWIQLERTNGSGSTIIAANVRAHDGAAPRASTIQIGGRTVSVNQLGVTERPSCAVTLSPNTFAMAAAGGTVAVDVTTGPGCAWDTTGRPEWIRQDRESGPGSARVTFTVNSNTNHSARTAAIAIGNQVVTFNQAAVACEFALSATSHNVAAAGGPVQFEVKTAEGCGWRASTKDTWIENLSFLGRGTGTVAARVGANSADAERRGIIEVAGKTFSVTQPPQPSTPSCTYTVTWQSTATKEGGPISRTITAAASGDTIVLSVKTGASCSWKHSAAPDWIADLPAGERRGSVDVNAPISCNATGQERRGSMTIAGQPASIVQPADPGKCRR